MKHIAEWFDHLGFIFHLDDSGKKEYGDGTSRLGLYWFPKLIGKDLTSPESLAFKQRYSICFEASSEPTRYPGWPVRTPEPHEWYARPGTMSRDNLIPCLACLCVIGDASRIWRLLRKIIKRGGFLWNTKHIGQQDESWKIPDWCGLGVIALSVRGLVSSQHGLLHGLLYLIALPFLLAADFILLLSSLWRVLSLYIDADNCGDCLNKIALMSAIKETKTETPFSLFARLLYSGLHPGAGPTNQARRRGYGPLTSFQHYFDNDKSPPLDEEWSVYLIERF